MTKREKLIEKLRNNPRNARFEQIDSLLTYYGFERRQTKSGTSHYVYKREGYPPITVPYKRPFINSVYVKQVIRILDEIQND
jgi:hypothetical protein